LPFSLSKIKEIPKIFIPPCEGPLVSLSLFKQLQHNTIPLESIESCYRDYKLKYEHEQDVKFYLAHQNDRWFNECYDPLIINKLKIEKSILCQNLARSFSASLKNDEFKGIKLELKQKDANNENIDVLVQGYNKEKDEFLKNRLKITDFNKTPLDISKVPYFASDQDRMTMIFLKVPKNVSYIGMLNVVKVFPGFQSISFSNPAKNSKFCRKCWVTFSSEEYCNLAINNLTGYFINRQYKAAPIKVSYPMKVSITPAYFEDRIVEDLEFSSVLIKLLDKERDIKVLISNIRKTA
jgi:hypothetical protein